MGLKTSTPRRRAPRKCRCRGVCAVRGVGPLLRPELCGVGTRGRRGRSRRRAERSRLAGHGHVRAPDSPLDLRIVQKEPYENWPHSPMRTLPRAPNRCIWIFRAYNRGCVNKAALARMLGALGRVGEPSLSTNLVHPPPWLQISGPWPGRRRCRCTCLWHRTQCRSRTAQGPFGP